MRLIDLDKIKPMDFPSVEMDGLDVVRYLNTLPTVDAAEVANTKFTPGQGVYVVERDECAHPFDVSGYMFLAQSDYVAIVTPYIDDMTELEETLEYLVAETVDNYCCMRVFPLEDCYATLQEAKAAKKDEDGEEN